MNWLLFFVNCKFDLSEYFYLNKNKCNRKKRFYRLSEIGQATLEKLSDDWHQVEQTLNRILD